MRTVVALVFNYSLNGLLADEDTEFWKFCFTLLDEHGGPDDDADSIAFLEGASAHVMGRTAYEGIAGHMPTATDHPWWKALNDVPKVVFSRTLEKAEWAGTTIVAGDTADEIETLRQGGDGHIVVWGGVALWRSLMKLDLIDEFRISMYPYITDKGTLLFDDVPPSYALELVSSTRDREGVLELRYRRRR